MDKRVTLLRDYFFKNGLIQEQSEEDKKERCSLLKTRKIFKNYGHVNSSIVDPYSSGEESDMEDDKLMEPTVRDVAMSMIDLNTIMTVNSVEEFPKEARPNLLFVGLDEWVTPAYMKLFLEDIPVFM
jgi:hypothetical protein